MFTAVPLEIERVNPPYLLKFVKDHIPEQRVACRATSLRHISNLLIRLLSNNALITLVDDNWL